jgi:hypothetical protein
MFDDYVEDFFEYSEGRGAIDEHQAKIMVVDMMFEGDKEGVDEEMVNEYVDEILDRRDADGDGEISLDEYTLERIEWYAMNQDHDGIDAHEKARNWNALAAGTDSYTKVWQGIVKRQ